MIELLRVLGSTVALLGLPPLAMAPGGTDAHQPRPSCTVTGYVAETPEELAALRQALHPDTANPAAVPDVETMSLDRNQTWVMPDQATLVVVVDASEPLPGGSVDLTLFGATGNVGWIEYAGRVENPSRYTEDLSLVELDVVRNVGLTVDSGPCRVQATLRADHSLLSSPVGAAAVGLTVLFGVLTVLMARRRKGGWVRRFLSAAPLGVVAVCCLAVLLYETGAISPFTTFPWWSLPAGMVLAALLPFTRRRREDAPPPGGPEPADGE